MKSSKLKKNKKMEEKSIKLNKTEEIEEEISKISLEYIKIRKRVFLELVSDFKEKVRRKFLNNNITFNTTNIKRNIIEEKLFDRFWEEVEKVINKKRKIKKMKDKKVKSKEIEVSKTYGEEDLKRILLEELTKFCIEQLLIKEDMT